ncbi:MAG: hypothetical protein P4M09_16945 [Devosia sp.]|nr:hypothetical protein [Devosia sp.]
MTVLTKEQRGAMPAEDFAVPGKRMLPLHDAVHVRMAWDQIGRTKGLTDAERVTGRRRILEKAKKLGIDTSDWTKIAAMRFEAMSVDLPVVEEHPNRMAFSGVLVRLDQPSDLAPHGSNGRKIILSSGAAEKALASILGMAVDYTPDFDGHDTQAKIGVITAATIEGNAIAIEGFIYAADFPEQAEAIQADKDQLGFSFEAQRIQVADLAADPLVITDCVFTGAAILKKTAAAYQTTSLAASAEDEKMDEATKKQLDELMTSVAGIATAVGTLATEVKEIKAAGAARIEAGKTQMDLVEPHAKALEACAGGMAAAGIGGHPTQGHVAILNRMAGNMRAAAANGELPSSYRDSSSYYAAAETPDVAKAVTAAVEAAVKPLNEKIAGMGTQITDLKAAAAKTVEAPARKTLPPAITSLLAKAGIAAPDGDAKLDVAAVDKALKDANLSVEQRMQTKTSLARAGLMN